MIWYMVFFGFSAKFRAHPDIALAASYRYVDVLEHLEQM